MKKLNFKYNKCAFTLAEVLITLVIIGVIAAITVPTLITKYQKEQTVTRLKKVYSTISQATQRAISDFGPVKTWEIYKTSTSNDAKNFFNKYMAPYLSLSVKAETLSNVKYTYRNGEELIGSNFARAYLADGSSLTFQIERNTDTTKTFKYFIDVNGDKKPNIIGKDVFEFKHYLINSKATYSNKFLPSGFAFSREEILESTPCCQCNKISGIDYSGVYCGALIMKDGWQIKDDYPW